MPNLDRPAGPALASGSNRIRVRYAETDRMDVVYHAHYFVWFETGRVELMRELVPAKVRRKRLQPVKELPDLPVAETATHDPATAPVGAGYSEEV